MRGAAEGVGVQPGEMESQGIGGPYCSLQLPENIGTSKVRAGLFSQVTSNRRRENGLKLHQFRLAVRTKIFSGGVVRH